MALVETVLGTREIGWSPISHVRAKLPETVSSGSNVAGWHQVLPLSLHPALVRSPSWSLIDHPSTHMPVGIVLNVLSLTVDDRMRSS